MKINVYVTAPGLQDEVCAKIDAETRDEAIKKFKKMFLIPGRSIEIEEDWGSVDICILENDEPYHRTHWTIYV